MANPFLTSNIDNDTDDVVVVNTMVNNIGVLTSENEEILQEGDVSIIIEWDSLPTSRDELTPW